MKSVGNSRKRPIRLSDVGTLIVRVLTTVLEGTETPADASPEMRDTGSGSGHRERLQKGWCVASSRKRRKLYRVGPRKKTLSVSF
jgi:hypothetical protein